MPDPFDTLGLPASFDLSREQVRAAWRARSGAAHPDAAPGVAERESTRSSADLNHAMRTLEDPEKRADALLVRLGGPTRDQEKGLPPTLLAEMLDAREALEDARAGGSRDGLEHARDWATRRRDEHIARAAALLGSLARGASAQALREARIELNAWRYTERMLEQIDEVTT